MCDIFTDCAIRISKAEPDELRAIYQTEIRTKKFDDEERAELTELHDKRASYWNRQAIGIQEARWK